MKTNFAILLLSVLASGSPIDHTNSIANYLLAFGLRSQCSNTFPRETNFITIYFRSPAMPEAVNFSFSQFGEGALVARPESRNNFLFRDIYQSEFEAEIQKSPDQDFVLKIYLPFYVLTYFLGVSPVDESIFVSEGNVKLLNRNNEEGSWVGHCGVERVSKDLRGFHSIVIGKSKSSQLRANSPLHSATGNSKLR